MEQEAKLKQQLVDELKQAMKSGDTLKRSVLRLVMAAIGNAEIAHRTTLGDGDILGIIAKEVKQRDESIAAFKQGSRQDLVDKEEADRSVLQVYLPEQMNHEGIGEAARAVILATGAQGLADKGKVMSRVIAQLKGRADGREINEVVSELLES